jgi:hypothetical protein
MLPGENYFNYFTETEEHFQRARGTGLFLLSPLDWALIESWKDSEVPLEAVLRGIDAAFEKWHKKKVKTHQVNSIAYCTQAIMEEARRIDKPREQKMAEAPFEENQLASHLVDCAGRLPEGFVETAAALRELAGQGPALLDDLEQLEQRLTAMEERMIAQVRASKSEEALFELRRDLEQQLKPYRSKMTAPQIMMLEKKFLDARLMEDAGLPRLSLFYLGA